MINIFLASVFATSWMTIFSYFLANKKNKQFREPEILNELLNGSSFLKVSINQKNAAGWVIHYSIGTLFTLIFHFLYKNNYFTISLLSGIIFGLLAGIIGVIGWKIMFYFNSNPPKILLKSFFIHLIVAHLIFSLSLIGWFYLSGFNFMFSLASCNLIDQIMF